MDSNTDPVKNGVENDLGSGSNKVEHILKSVGGYSKYQKLLTFVLIFPQFVTAMIVLSTNFTGSTKVPYYCSKGLGQHSIDHYAVCGINCTLSSNDDFEHITFTSVVQEWDLVCSQSWIPDMVTSFQMAGMTTGAIVSSIFSDMYGRRKCFLLQTLCMGVLGMIPALAWNPWSYAFFRFLAGFGVGACFVVYLSHLMEFLTPSWRTICGALSFWPLGEMLLGLLAYLLGSWRLLTVVTASPALLLLLAYPFILESPRWLLIRRRTSEAHEVFCRIAKWNSQPLPILKDIEELQEEVVNEEQNSAHGLAAVMSIFRHKRLRKDMGILILCNLTCSVVYYGVTFEGKNLVGSPYWNMFYMGVFDFLASPAPAPFNNWIGRRKTFIMFMGMGTICIGSLVLVGFLSETPPPFLITGLSLSGRFGIVAAWGALTCLILETAPTNMRSVCLGVSAFVGYFGGIFGPQLFLLREVATYIPYIALCVLTTSSSIASYFIRETLKRPLEDVSHPTSM